MRIRTHNSFILSQRVQFFLDLDYFFRQQTRVTDYLYSLNGAALQSDQQKIMFSSSQRLTGTLGALFEFLPQWKLITYVSHPVFGKNSPLWELGYVENLIGPSITGEIRYEF